MEKIEQQDSSASGKVRISVTGLGYVGLPLALAFAQKVPVVGFDTDARKIALLKQGKDPMGECGKELFEKADVLFTSDEKDLRKASFHIVAVPTPIDAHNQPDLAPLLQASETLARNLSKGDYVVYESTVYPGATQEDCIPVLEAGSGLACGKDFKVGYSPERINPGDRVHTLANTVKIVSACDEPALESIASVYGLVVEAGLHKAPSIKVAEAAKIIENTQRDVNIALMNELSILFSRMGINTYDVLEAAGTKWNFLKFNPGLVGGHCIGVDPYYLVYKARELKYYPQLIDAGRFINDSMGGYVAKKIIKRLIASGKPVLGARVLVLGITFKENVPDIRNSKVADLVRELEDFGIRADVCDPKADPQAVREMYGFDLKAAPDPRAYDAVVVAVAHRQYRALEEKDFLLWLKDRNGLVADVKGLYRHRIPQDRYWSL